MEEILSNIIYAIKVGSASYGNLTILDVKIGRTTNIKSTESQYKRSHSVVEILDLWESNEQLTLQECEKGVHLIAEKYAYERNSEKFIFLQESYKDFARNVNQLLNKTTKEELGKGKTGRKTKRKKENYTGRKPKFVKFQRRTFEVETWREVLLTIAKQIYGEKEDFSKVLDIKGRTRVYFSKSHKDKKHGGELVRPQEITDTPYYFEGNISANKTMTIINNLLEIFGYKKSDIEIGYE